MLAVDSWSSDSGASATGSSDSEAADSWASDSGTAGTVAVGTVAAGTGIAVTEAADSVLENSAGGINIVDDSGATVWCLPVKESWKKLNDQDKVKESR